MQPVRSPLTRLLTIVSIIAVAVATFFAVSGPVGADTASKRAAGSAAYATHAKKAQAHKKKHKKKHKKTKKSAKKHKAKKRTAAKVAPKRTSAAASTTPSQATGPYAYNRLRHRYTFAGTKVDETQWGIYNTNGSWSKDKDARRRELVTVSGNMLHVATTGTKGSGLCLCRKSVKPTAPYGRYEIRARASANADHGFAMLLWPNAENWPEGGEIDIAEYDSMRTKLWTTVHYHAQHKRYITGTKGDFTQWHTYGVEWTPKYIKHYVDGKVVMTVTDPAAIPRNAMHLALQAGRMNNQKTPSNSSATLDVAWINEYA